MLNGQLCDVQPANSANAPQPAADNTNTEKPAAIEQQAASSSGCERDCDASADDDNSNTDGGAEQAGAVLDSVLAEAQRVVPDIVGAGALLYHQIRNKLLPLDRILIATGSS